jgi:hypothetical protein
MNSALFAKDFGAIPYPGDGLNEGGGDGVTDFSNLNGLLLADSATANLLVLNNSPTIPAVAVVLNGNPSNRQTDIGILGAIPPVRLVAHGVINKFQRVIQDATGGIIADPGAGTQRVVVGVALEAATASGQFILVQTIAPMPCDTW